MGFDLHLRHFGTPGHPVSRNGDLKVQNGHGIATRWQGNRRSTPYKIAHHISHFHFSITSETPKDGVDQTFTNIFFDLINGHREVRMAMIVLQDIPDGLIDHAE